MKHELALELEELGHEIIDLSGGFKCTKCGNLFWCGKIPWHLTLRREYEHCFTTAPGHYYAVKVSAEWNNSWGWARKLTCDEWVINHIIT